MSVSDRIFHDLEFMRAIAARIESEAAAIPTELGSEPAHGPSIGVTRLFHDNLQGAAKHMVETTRLLSKQLDRVGDAVRITAQEAADRDDRIAGDVTRIDTAVSAAGETPPVTSHTGSPSATSPSKPPRIWT